MASAFNQTLALINLNKLQGGLGYLHKIRIRFNFELLLTFFDKNFNQILSESDRVSQPL